MTDREHASNTLALSNIVLRRGPTTILDDVSWTVRKGQHWAVLGANGSGKTSLLKLVTGYEWPTEGTVEVLGHTFGQCELQVVRRQLGWVSSAIAQRLPDGHAARRVVLSGIEATIGLYRRNTDDQTRRAEAALAQVRACNVAERPWGLLSQGERQRVLIARALVAQPRLLVLDEPCVGLDPAAREHLIDDLSTLATTGDDRPTLIYVTHHIDELPEWIDRVLVLKEGRVLAAGPRNQVLTDAVLSDALDCPVTVERHDGRYHLRVRRTDRSAR